MNDFDDPELEAGRRDVFAHQAAAATDAFEESPVVVDMVEATPGETRRSKRSRVVFGVSGLVAVAAATALVVTDLGVRAPDDDPGVELAAAISRMSEAGSFDASYELTVAAGTPPTTIPLPDECTAWDDVVLQTDSDGLPVIPEPEGPGEPHPFEDCVLPLSDSPGMHITGDATVHVAPFAVESHSLAVGLEVAVFADSEQVWIDAPAGAIGQSEVPLRAFGEAFIASNLGPRQGPVVMLSLANPAGYLTLTPEQALNATELGESDLDGMTVTEYAVTMTPDQVADVGGASEAQAATVEWAVDVLRDHGYTGSTLRVGVGDDGYVYWVVSVAHFADGGSATIEARFANIGCADSTTLPNGSVYEGDTTCVTDTTVASE